MSEEGTEGVGVVVARGLLGGRGRGEVGGRGVGGVVALEGAMGAGKTRFVRGLVKAMGGDERGVSSPTFVLVNEYAIGAEWGGVMYHLDAYRAGGVEDFEGIGFEELLEQGGVVVVEWASRVAELLPEGTVWVRVRAVGGGVGGEGGEGDTRREFEVG